MKRKLMITGIVAVSFCLVAVAVFMTVQQSRYLGLRIFEKEITEMELIEYEGTAFESDILSLKTFTGEKEVLNDLKNAMNMENIALFHPKATSKILFLYYEDGTVMNAYIDDGKIGLSYGSVWIKVMHLSEILEQFQEEVS